MANALARMLACPLLLSAAGCSGLDFEVDRTIAEQRVPGSVISMLTGSLFENPVPLNVDVEQETKKRDTGPAKAVRMEHLSLAITATAEPEDDMDDFDFLDQLEVFIESSQPESDLPRVQIAGLDEVPEDVRDLDIPTIPGIDLLPYAQEGARITSSASGSAPPDDVTFDGRFTLVIEVL